jgi:hypothetical protein
MGTGFTWPSRPDTWVVWPWAVRKTLEGDDVQTYMADLIEKICSTHIEVITQAIVVDHSGMPGHV